MEKFRKIVDDVYILETPSGGVWSGIVFIDGEEKILIDSGDCAENIDNLLCPALEALGYSLKDIVWLCNTHCHGDHVGGHHRILELADIQVAAYVKSCPKIKDPLKYAKLLRAAYPEFSPPASSALKGVEVDRILQDGDIIGGRLKVISTPGHDTDCVSFYDTKTKTLITGDSLQGNGTATQGTALYMDLDVYRNTLEKLMGMDTENIISGHPYLFSGDMAVGKAEVEAYLKRCRDITDIYDMYIRSQVQAGCTDKVKLAEGLIKHMNNKKPAFLFLPLYTVDAHLCKMQECKKETK